VPKLEQGFPNRGDCRRSAVRAVKDLEGHRRRMELTARGDASAPLGTTPPARKPRPYARDSRDQSAGWYLGSYRLRRLTKWADTCQVPAARRSIAGPCPARLCRQRWLGLTAIKNGGLVPRWYTPAPSSSVQYKSLTNLAPVTPRRLPSRSLKVRIQPPPLYLVFDEFCGFTAKQVGGLFAPLRVSLRDAPSQGGVGVAGVRML
jgi:hypothetical protein